MAARKSASKSFAAVLEHSGNSLNWIIVRIPLDVAKIWGKRGQLRVQGEINGFAFRCTLFPTGQGSHYMIVNRAMQKGGKTQAGMEARFRLEPDDSPREVTVPAELLRVLRQAKRLQKFYDSLNESMRRYLASWVGDPKQSATRIRRAEQLAVRFMETMEAEIELPPLIQSALMANPKARAGWEQMSPTHRRRHLLGIFYYSQPASRARRLAKAMEEMVQYAEKRDLHDD
ncbi:MAG TPA: YdeI/OmpD-associated family protein [Candidatus Angelobacter sp.]|nr:YdeI/OmpD-associated family protein [Candidatus Angelobacter sp.]